MASGHRKRKAELVRQYLLTPAGLTNIPETNRGNDTYMNKTVTLSIQNSPYSASGTGYGGPCNGGAVPFTDGATAILSNGASNCDGNWSLILTASNGLIPYSGAYGGETSAYNDGFLRYNTAHRFFPYPNTADVSGSDVGTVILYSKDGPQTSNFNPFYFPSSAKVLGTNSQAPTSSIIYNQNCISSAVGDLSKLKIVIAGAIPTGTVGSSVQVWYGTFPTFNLGPIVQLTSSTPMMVSGSLLTSSLSGIKITYSSSLETYNKDVFGPGFFVYITGTNA